MIDRLRLSDLQRCIPSDLLGNDVSFDRVSTDSRHIQSGDLFVALRGKSFDGNRFAVRAAEKGAVAAIVSADQHLDIPQLVVEDTEQALGYLGHLNRNQSSAVVVAVTGSQGKTSVKEMAGRILGRSFNVLVTQGNLNNMIGAPLTLLELNKAHQRAVIELGANAQGEIAWTAKITDPHIVLINNAAGTHLEGFGSLQGVVEAKGEIIDSATSTQTVILNADDPNVPYWHVRAGTRACRFFSMSGARVDDRDADYSASQIALTAEGSNFVLHTPEGECECRLSLPGHHNVANAVAAAALSMEAGATLEDVRDGLADMRSVEGRLHLLPGIAGSRLLDDSYNASPASFRAAIDVLMTLKNEQDKAVLVMGDMGELGEQAAIAHRNVGEYAHEKGVDRLWAVGELSALAVEAFGSGACHFDSKSALLRYAKTHLQAHCLLLIKGSRSAAMDEVCRQLSRQLPKQEMH